MAPQTKPLHRRVPGAMPTAPGRHAALANTDMPTQKPSAWHASQVFCIAFGVASNPVGTLTLPRYTAPMQAERPGETTHHKRLVRLDAPGDARFLTFSCFRRQPFLSRERTSRWFIEGLERSRDTHGFELWAYVIMPEHVHLLVYPGHAPHRVADILYTLKKSVAWKALAFVRKHAPVFLDRMRDDQPNGKVAHRFWQRGGGYDENLYRPSTIWEKIEYIHDNPVRRGLCDSPADWKWSSFRAFECADQEPIRIDFDSIPDRSARSM